ncbi:uncharacterized protein LOC121530242 [Drosophila eugracilis]|uniref:uncharacterized protein LOC121530242 n=1 Tax=Drosophila eugracilis TaxID=29029 RepID=UPI001BD9C7C4|nr:uncharacterized protein LOC121530242 [Drosophila eugracilis]
MEHHMSLIVGSDWLGVLTVLTQVWIVTAALLKVVNGSYKFNSLNCEVVAPEIVYLKECRIKAIDRKHNKLNVTVVLKEDITQIDLNFRIVKREIGGWHPFFYNIRMEVCEFFRNRRKFFIANYMYSIMRPFSNINHTCPYVANEEISIKNFSPSEDTILAKFPLDYGQYGLQSVFYVRNAVAFKVNGSVLFFR